MFELKRANVHRIVATEAERDALIAHGFALVEAEKAEKPAALACPHCGKEYKKQADLDKHIDKEHKPAGTGNTPPAGDPPAPPAGAENDTPPAGGN